MLEKIKPETKMSRRSDIHQRFLNEQLVISTSPEVLRGGEILPTYTAKAQPVQYTSRHFYSDFSNQNRSPVIRVVSNHHGLEVQTTPQNLRLVGVNSSQDLLKTQNVKRGNKVIDNLADSNSGLQTARNFSGSGGREQQSNPSGNPVNEV